MKYHLPACLFFFVMISLLAASVAECCSPPVAESANIVIDDLPDGATVLFDGYATSSVGPRRVFTTPAIDANQSFEYLVTVRIPRDEKATVFEKRIVVGAGQVTEVSVRDLELAKKKESAKPPSIGATPSEPVAAFVLRNPKPSIPIHYQVKWGANGQWTHWTVPPGKNAWHSYPLDNNGQAPAPYVRFWDNHKWREYRLGFYAVANPAHGSPNVFRYHSYGNFWDLYRVKGE